ncbi:MAG: DUF6152 family protein [Steroidobacteraceae bacterium]
MKKYLSLMLTGLLVCLLGGAAQAHHSSTQYDQANPVALSGTVKEFRYTNPHTWIYLIVPDGKGGEQQWDLEGPAVNMLVRRGWTRDTLQAGMKIKAKVAPRKDGTAGGEWIAVIEIDGKSFELNQ